MASTWNWWKAFAVLNSRPRFLSAKMSVSPPEAGHSMTISDYAIVFATVAGPILAVQVQKAIERAGFKGVRVAPD